MFSSAVIFVSKPHLIDGFRAELKDVAVNKVSVAQSEDECVEMLIATSDALVILDWDVGGDKALNILEACLRPVPTDVRPILLITASSSVNLIGVAAEFGVARLHRGELSRADMKAILMEIGKMEKELPPDVRDKISLAGDARRRNDWTMANAILEKLHNEHQDSLAVLTEYAENLLHLGNHQKAIDLLTPKVDLPDVPIRLLYIQGRCLMKVGRYTDATIAFERAKTMNPMHVDRLVQLGNAYLEVDNVARAEKNFDAALAIDSHNERAKSGKGQCLLMQGEINEALSFLKSVSGAEEKAAIFNSAAVLCMRNGRYEQGMDLYKIAVRVVGSQNQVLAKLAFNMGIGYNRWKLPEKALALFKAATRLDPAHDAARRNVELMEVQMGVVADASALSDHPLTALLPRIGGSSGFSMPPAPMSDLKPQSSEEFEEEDVIRKKKTG